MSASGAGAGPSLSERRRRLMVVGLGLGLLLAALDQFVFSTALPTIAADLGGTSALLWVNTAFVLTGTVVMPVYGALGDRLGRRRVLVVALTVFLAGSVAGALAPSMPALITARAVQGLGGGGLLVLVQAIVADVVPARERAPYLTAIDAVFALAAVTGPLVGGWLAEGPGWRWAFWVNLPLGLVAVAAALLLVPAPPRRDRARTPVLLPLPLLRRRAVALPVAGGLLLAMAGFGAVAYLPTYLQLAGGLSPTRAGLMMLALIAGLGLATTAAAQLVRRTGRLRALPVVGSGLAAGALLGLATLGTGAGLGAVGLCLFALGAGIGCAWEVLVVVVQDAVPPAQVGVATAANGFFREVGVLLGTALVGALLTARLDRLPTAPAPGAAAYAEAMTPAFGWLVPLALAAAVTLALVRADPLAEPVANDPRAVWPAARKGSTRA